jgi:hypothetical protein
MYDVTVIKVIKQVQEAYPELRVGQIILNAVPEEELYYIDNKILSEKLSMVYFGEEDEKNTSIKI